MTLDTSSTVAVVGGSLAGLRAAETLRAEGFAGRIVFVGAESHLPYDRPPLSKQMLAGTWGLDRVQLRPAEKIDALGLDLRLGHRAVALDVDAHTVELDDGAAVVYDGLVVATGALPRALPGTESLPGVRTLRTLEDCAVLASAVAEPEAHVVVVGAGFIGCEVAATSRSLGARVTVVEPLAVPLARALGERMGASCAAMHRAHGVELRTGVGVSGVSGARHGGATVVLDDGNELSADVVVVGVGVAPATSWLAGSGLELADGVVTDATLYAADDVVVAGDVTRWYDERWQAPVRVEHWTNAAEQGVWAARNLVAGRADANPYVPVPYFWSDQYDTKIQVIGLPAPDDDVEVVDGSLEDGRFVALYGRRGALSAALAFNRPRQLMSYRPLLEAKASFARGLAHSPG